MALLAYLDMYCRTVVHTENRSQFNFFVIIAIIAYSYDPDEFERAHFENLLYLLEEGYIINLFNAINLL
ncbi:hypothetical protein RIR_jg30353.t1 [Rhizophagus irregularis DAOM 181602=DAOM 197198]|nr:hypothetical protein RIR_jg30353.t1 [Rhizophagus irregularis DAOM 181602=DAOM 197198]